MKSLKVSKETRRLMRIRAQWRKLYKEVTDFDDDMFREDAEAFTRILDVATLFYIDLHQEESNGASLILKPFVPAFFTKGQGLNLTQFSS